MMRDIFKKVLDGGGVAESEAAALLQDDREDVLEKLLQAASTLRDRVKGRTVSFSKKVFLPLTNLCRDYCGYCIFRNDPGDAGAHTMNPDEVLALCRQGERMGCREALFSLGDKPELLFPQMRKTLSEFGHATTLSYLAEMCRMVVEKTSLFPHSNPGVMTAGDLAVLKPVNVSMGLMLENTSMRLMRRGQSHYHAPDKHPQVRLKTIEEAGKQGIAFTTGILIGIGETVEERVDSLFAIKSMHEKYGHIQEVIIQNFRAKPEIPMAVHPEPSLKDMLKTAAVARLILGENMNIQAPPNLTEDFSQLLHAGINDWGGVSPVTPDFINPERPWPHLEMLKEAAEKEGFTLCERFAVYPDFFHLVPEALLPRILQHANKEEYVKKQAQRHIAAEAQRKPVLSVSMLSN